MVKRIALWVLNKALLNKVGVSARTVDGEIILELSGGYIIGVGANELGVVSTVDDPPKLRLGSPWPCLSLGCISWNRMVNGSWQEVVLLQGKVDERYRHDPNNLYAEITLHMRDGRIADADKAMIPVLTWRHDGLTFHVPCFFEQGGGQQPPVEPIPTPPIEEPPPPTTIDYVALHGAFVHERYLYWLGRKAEKTPVGQSELETDSENVDKYDPNHTPYNPPDQVGWLDKSLSKRAGGKPA